MNKNTNVSKKEREHSGAKSTSWSKVIPNQIFRRLHKEKKNPQSRTSGCESCLHQLTAYLCDFEQVTFSVLKFLIFQTRIIKVPSLGYAMKISCCYDFHHYHQEIYCKIVFQKGNIPLLPVMNKVPISL